MNDAKCPLIVVYGLPHSYISLWSNISPFPSLPSLSLYPLFSPFLSLSWECMQVLDAMGNAYVAVTFFVSMVVLGAFFVMNLILGVLSG